MRSGVKGVGLAAGQLNGECVVEIDTPHAISSAEVIVSSAAVMARGLYPASALVIFIFML